MKTLEYMRWADPPVWKATLADLLPLWLFTLTLPVGSVCPFWLAVGVILFLIWLKWITPELIVYSLFPIIPSFIFEEVPPAYKAPFMLFCAVILSLGILGYRLSLHKGSLSFGWLVLLAVFAGTWMLAYHANQNYWQMTAGTPWWVLFFSP